MAADRPAHPSPYPWTHWGLQLERDLAAGINRLSDGKNRPVADESSGCPGAERKPILHLTWTAQNHFAYFFFMLRGLTVRLCVSIRDRHDSEGEQNLSSLNLPS